MDIWSIRGDGPSRFERVNRTDVENSFKKIHSPSGCPTKVDRVASEMIMNFKHQAGSKAKRAPKKLPHKYWSIMSPDLLVWYFDALDSAH
jgi:hypothetical protein